MSRREERDDDLGAVEAGPGRAVGKYQLLAVLGRGGMADVFLALSRGPMGFNKLVVLKRLRRALADDPGFRDMFLDEARLAARLNHPNVVHTHEVGEDGGVYFIAMEYLEGQSLNKIIRELSKRDEILPALCARIVSDALAGLHYAHELQDFDGKPLSIIHRDVSPHNVFVTYDGSVKMVDFGIAKAALSSVQTEVGVLKGKVAYMAPEQAAGEVIDPRADVFAMGIVLWELLAQERLMTGDSAAATLHRLLSAPIPSVRKARPDVSPQLEAVVARALEKDASRRFRTALEMRDALEDCIAADGKGVRQEEIGREISELFAEVRVKIQRQIQMHMAGIPPTPASGEALPGSDASFGGPVLSSSQLPMLGVGGGSGSGVVAGYSAPSSSDRSLGPSIPSPSGPAIPGRRGVAVWITVAAVTGVVAVAAFSMGRSNARPASTVDSVTDFHAPSPPAPAEASAPPTAAVRPPEAPHPSDPAPESSVAITRRSLPTKPSAATVRHGGSGAASPSPAVTVAAAEDGSQGFLNFDSYPWTQVSENGKSLGQTPIVHLALAPGLHTLSLENPEQGIKKTYAVTIKGGETLTRQLGLK